MAAPLGNQNATKDRRIRAALLEALDKKSKAEGIQALEQVAAKVVDLALAGDLAAFKELADRIDGKAHQSVEANVNATLEVVELRRYAG